MKQVKLFFVEVEKAIDSKVRPVLLGINETDVMFFTGMCSVLGLTLVVLNA